MSDMRSRRRLLVGRGVNSGGSGGGGNGGGGVAGGSNTPPPSPQKAVLPPRDEQAPARMLEIAPLGLLARCPPLEGVVRSILLVGCVCLLAAVARTPGAVGELAKNRLGLPVAMLGLAFSFQQGLASQVKELKADLKSDITELKAELKSDIKELKAELKSDITELKAELKSDIKEVRSDFKRMEILVVCTLVLSAYSIVKR